jgi:hypothetical protein
MALLADVELGIVSIGQNESAFDGAGTSAGTDAPVNCRLDLDMSFGTSTRAGARVMGFYYASL